MFAPDQSAAQSNSTNTGRNKGDFEPALGFVNVYLPSNDGGRVKLGALPLKGSKDREKALFTALNDPQRKDEILNAILGKLVLDFQSAEQSAAKGFDLGIDL